MTRLVRPAGAAAMVILFALGIAALAYARWMRPLAAGDAALAEGRYDEALAHYAQAESRFDRSAAVRQLLSDEYSHVMANQLWLLHRLRRYDDTVDVAGRAPEGAQPHFWAGAAYFEKARMEDKPEPRLAWLTRAEDELRRAVEAAPDDWDTKYDFEVVTRLASELRKRPETPPNQLMQLLRPQPKPGAKPVKRVG